MKKQDNQHEDNQETFTEQAPPSPKKDKEWIAWRKAKRDGRLTEHRKMLKSSAYRKMRPERSALGVKKSEANQEDRTRQK